MPFPLSPWDISLWLGITAIVLLITEEITSSSYGKTNILINKKRLRNVAIALALLFLIIVVVNIQEIITSP